MNYSLMRAWGHIGFKLIFVLKRIHGTIPQKLLMIPDTKCTIYVVAKLE